MTDGPSEPALHLLANLRVDVDGVHAQVHGDGPELIVETDHPIRLAQAALRGLPTGVGGSRTLAAKAGELLADEGVAVSLHGPRGRVATIGARVDSPIGSALVGTRRVSVAVPPNATRLLAAAAALGVVLPILRGLRNSHR